VFTVVPPVHCFVYPLVGYSIYHFPFRVEIENSGNRIEFGWIQLSSAQFRWCNIKRPRCCIKCILYLTRHLAMRTEDISTTFQLVPSLRCLGSLVVSVLDSGAEGQSRRCRVTVLGKLFTPCASDCASVHQAAKLVAALLRVARVTAGLAESNGSLPSGL